MILKWLAAMALMVAGPAYAEQGCPDGLYPGGAAPGQICIPMPGYGLGGNGSSGPSEHAAPRWANRWGSIAIGDDKQGNGIMGKSESAPSRGKAKKLALADCEAKGGIGCEIAHSYYNQCVAVAWGDSVVNTTSAVDSETASTLAIDSCNKASTNCGIYYTGCSYPEQVQ